MSAANRTDRVLVIEDEKSVRDLITAQLRRLGYSADEATSVAQARSSLHAHTYDVVVADVHLPDGDILDVAREVRAEHPELPFVFITGDHDEVLRSRALSEDPAGFLLKPFRLSELNAVVAHTLEEHGRTTTGGKPKREVEAALDELPGVRVLLRSTTEAARTVPLKLYLTIAAVAVIVLVAAFVIGYLMQNGSPELP